MNCWSYFFSLVLLCISLSSVAQNFTINGVVEDAETGEKLLGANVYDRITIQGSTTNAYGFYSVTLPKDSIKLTVSYIGYETFEQNLFLDKDMLINVSLAPEQTLQEVVVSAEKQVESIQEESQMSTIVVPIEQIRKMPALLGEVDIVKTLQLLPGVQSGVEGASGMYVRGGGPDQNLVLLDGVPVYNVSHLFGFFSVFNADAISSVKLIKGGYPARYAGRLSSVLDIRMKEGNSKQMSGAMSIGLISAKGLLEGPIGDKTSFMLTGRRTYIDVLTRPLISASTDGEGTGGYYFYDWNAKINHKISDKDQLFLSFYTGDDRFFFNFKDDFDNGSGSDSYEGSIGWGNLTSVLRYNRILTPKLFANATMTYSQYKLNNRVEAEYIEIENGTELKDKAGLEYFSGINDWGGKIDFDYLPKPNHFIKFGISGTHHTFKPGAVQITDESSIGGELTEQLDTLLNDTRRSAWELDAYVEDDIKLGAIKANLGLHFSSFLVDGKSYFSLQPRISSRYLITEDLSAKVSFAMMAQYIHLLSNSGINLPTDLWVPSTDQVEPQQSWQVAGGLAYNWNKDYEVSLEAYYKRMSNIIAYKDGASFVDVNGDWESQVAAGLGKSYGLELFIQKKTGRFTGWLGYTLAWSNRLFDRPGEEINFGEEFSYRYDRRHDISLVGVYELGEGVDVSATWVYGTGVAVTLPLQKFEGVGFQEYYSTLYEYGERNSFRMGAYHRLDVGINFVKQKKRGERVWNFSFYNAYNRQNPFFVYQGRDDDGENVFRQVNLFPVIPSISYTRRW